MWRQLRRKQRKALGTVGAHLKQTAEPTGIAFFLSKVTLWAQRFGHTFRLLNQKTTRRPLHELRGREHHSLRGGDRCQLRESHRHCELHQPEREGDFAEPEGDEQCVTGERIAHFRDP